MTPASVNENLTFIWATRGRSWGFRFLRDGGAREPLRVYEEAFSGVEEQPTVWKRWPHRTALRFPDPEGRTDQAGRVIPHDFVLIGAWSEDLQSFEEARQHIWRQVADEFQAIWDQPGPPAVRR